MTLEIEYQPDKCNAEVDGLLRNPVLECEVKSENIQLMRTVNIILTLDIKMRKYDEIKHEVGLVVRKIKNKTHIE